MGLALDLCNGEEYVALTGFVCWWPKSCQRDTDLKNIVKVVDIMNSVRTLQFVVVGFCASAS